MRTLAALGLALIVAFPATAADASRLAPLDFLLGTWKATGGGAPGVGSGGFTFSSDLQGRVIVRRNHADYPATADRPASRHDDLMVIAVVSGALRADYYDSEGHVVHYAVDCPGPGSAVFVADPDPKAPRFRLSYELAEDGTLLGRFEIAPPGKPDAFAPYLSWTARKVKEERGG